MMNNRLCRAPADILAPFLRREPFRAVPPLLHGDGVPLRRLQDEDALAPLLARFAASQRAKPDDRASASLWFCRYIAVLLPQAMLALLLASWRFPLDAARTMLTLEQATGRPLALILPDIGIRSAEMPVVTLLPLLDDHLVPLVAVLERVAGLPDQVAWSNFASLLEHCAGYALRHGADKERVASILTCRHPSWARIGALGDFLGMAANGQRRRRICCLCFELGGAYCRDCPARLPARRGRA